MSALADALVAAQSRAVAALGKQYVGGAIDADTVRADLESVGLTDEVDVARLIAARRITWSTIGRWPDVAGDPYSKERQLARGQRRYRRKVASAKDWQKIVAAKQGPCRVTVKPTSNGGTASTPQPITFHHLVPRSQGGDDVPDNIVPLSQDAHRRVTERDPSALAALAASLTDSERAYVVGKLGEDGLVRLFGTAR